MASESAGKLSCLVVITLVFAQVFASCSAPASGESAVSEKQAYGLVEELIIEGRYGGYVVGPVEKGKPRTLRFVPSTVNDEPFDSSKVRHDGAIGWNGYLIYLQDQRERALFGLLSGGGWEMSGALIDVVRRGDISLELFKLAAVRWHSGLFDNYVRERERAYHFYLVRRPGLKMKGTILKKWTFGYDDIVFFTPERASGYRSSHTEGYMRYSPDKNEVKVIVKGLNREFEETVILDHD